LLIYNSDAQRKDDEYISMKLLLFSDLHVSQTHCLKLVEMAEDADIVVGAGDFGRFRTGIKKTINWLKVITKPAVVVPGNSESYRELTKACEDWVGATVLHGNGIELQGLSFFGIGGGVPVTPFGPWSWDFTESQATALLADCPNDAILVSHSPPKGIADLSSSGKHLGSEAVLDTIKSKTPSLVVCGHIHESWGSTEKLGNTMIVNAGPQGMIIEV
jgi:Icc-related predicted phosphoesterase